MNFIALTGCCITLYFCIIILYRVTRIIKVPIYKNVGKTDSEVMALHELKVTPIINRQTFLLVNVQFDLVPEPGDSSEKDKVLIHEIQP